MFFLVRKTFEEKCTILDARFLESGVGRDGVDDGWSRVQENLTIEVLGLQRVEAP